MNLATAAAQFNPERVHLDTASVGLGCVGSQRALADHFAQWASGGCDPASFDAVIDRCRSHAAALLGTTDDRVAIISQLSVAAGLVAHSLPVGATVITADQDFTSVLFPFLVRAERGELNVVSAPLHEVCDRVAAGADAVAVSSVQSADGAVIDLGALSAAAKTSGAFTLIDATQSTGWLPMSADSFDVVACGGYKWLCAPRGTGFMTASGRAIEIVDPILANWYAGEDRWSSIYRGPLRLASTARRFDLSPAWPVWVGAEPGLELLASVGVLAIEQHNVELANRFRKSLEMAPSNSAIVSISADDAAAVRLRDAGVTFAGRDGRMRLSFHLYNTVDDVDAALDALAG